MSRIESSIIYGGLVDCAGSEANLVHVVSDTIRVAMRDVLRRAPSYDHMEACQKAVFGIFFEKDLVENLGLPCKVSKTKNPHTLILDTRVAGFNIDIKTTVGNTWMIPQECIGEWGLLLKLDWRTQKYYLGVLKMEPQYLTKGTNQDRKHSVSAEGRRHIDWFITDQSYA